MEEVKKEGLVARIIHLCMANKGFVLLCVAILALFSYRAMRDAPIDALPDLTETQVIVFAEWMGRSPELVEDQITYPLVASLRSAPKVKAVRGYSMFGMSFVYVIFEDGTDIYWARSRVLEYLEGIKSRLPKDAMTVLGPDATGLGWVFQYALVDRTGTKSLSELRSIQDYYIRYALQQVEGVAEVATIGGFEKEYQVVVDPVALLATGVSFDEVRNAIREANRDVGGRIMEVAGKEFFISGKGYIKGVEDLENLTIKMGKTGVPVRLRDVAKVQIGGEQRRGVGDMDGQGEAVSGIVVARVGANAYKVIEGVKRRLEEIKQGLGEGLEIKVVYDRSALIERALSTLKHALLQEGIVVAIVIVLFLLHIRSSFVPIIVLGSAVLFCFLPLYLAGVTNNIMSLGGIAIAIGAMVDSAIVIIENAHKRLEGFVGQPHEKERILIESVKEVAPSIFFALLIIAVSFLPVFGLTGEAGKLFRPLALTKTLAMLLSALLSITLLPAVIGYAVRGRIRSESEHPVSKALIAVYKPFILVALRWPISTLLIGVLLILSTIPVVKRLGSEFMPPLNEGDILYMPTTLPNISVEEAKRVLRIQNRLIKEVPEVELVYGKAGKSTSPTDPAPISMVETVIKLRPESEWRKIKVKRFYSELPPSRFRNLLAFLFPEERRITFDEIVRELDAKVRLPGWTNAWTMPIKARIDMLTTGVRTPVGIKVLGSDLKTIEKVAIEIEKALGGMKGARGVIAERSLGGAFVDVVPDMEALSRYGLRQEDVLDFVEMQIGGLPVSETVEGRGRFSISVRYPRDVREDPESLKRALFPLHDGSYVELGEIAEIRISEGASMIKDEDGMLAVYVYVDVDEKAISIGEFVNEAKKVVKASVNLPQGVYLKWTGQYEVMEEMKENMKVLVPLSIFLVVLLLYLHYRSFAHCLIILLTVPFALVGSFWFLHILDYRLSAAVWVGVISMVGLAAETGIVMVVYLDHEFQRRKALGQIKTLDDIVEAHIAGAVERVRPKMMTVLTTFVGLLPLMWATGSGADVMKRIAAPMVGGLITSTFLTLEILPVLMTYYRYFQMKSRKERHDR